MKVMFTAPGIALRFQIKEIEFNYYPSTINIIPRHKITHLASYQTIEGAKKAHPDAVEFPSMVQLVAHFMDQSFQKQREEWFKNLKFGETTA